MAGERNCENLIGLLKFRKESGDTGVADVLHNRSKFSSSMIQNELIELSGQGPFTLIVDETTDCSNQTQHSISLRFVYEHDCKHRIEERFLKFVQLESCTGEQDWKTLFKKASIVLFSIILILLKGLFAACTLGNTIV